ncbi:MAG: murein biosynthesis integral membrane protein MurJ [Candidatus Hydrogenedentes bacterium]|nr:murein biosynthesis integral membrane protein MurJ [Candidatus Hydrogenedentota bacterium]
MTDKSDRHSLTKFAAIFALGTMLSRVLGLVRDVLISTAIPVGPREAFLVAFRLPNMLRDVVGEGAANAAFIPVMSETLEKRKEKMFREVVAAAFGTMILLLGAITILGVIFVPEILQGVNILQPITGGKEYTAEELTLLTALTRWTFPYIFFIGLAVFSMAALFTVKHYSTPSWAPALLNVAMIGCIAVFAWSRAGTAAANDSSRLAEAAWALVIGVWIGGIAQVAVQYYAMGKFTGVWRPSFDVRRKEIATMFALLGPIVIGQAAGEVNKLVDLMFAYKSGAGAVTWLYSANRLVQLPLTIFGFATAAAVLPAASRAAARNDHNEMREVIMQGLRQSFFMVLPSMIGLIVLGRPIVKLIFGWGHTSSATDIDGMSIATAIYATGLLAFAWVKVTVSGFFAVKDTRSPVIISSGSMILNMILCALWVKPYGYQGLAWATTISYTANFVALYALLSARHGAMWDGPFLTALVRMSAATAGMAAVGYATYVGMLRLIPADGFVERLVQAGLPIAASVGAFLLLAWMFGVTELLSFAQLVTRRFSRQKK